MPSTTTKLGFAAVGHVTNDHLESGVAPGGAALYASLTAARLGCAASAVTRYGPDFVGLAELAVAGVVVSGLGALTTTFENRYHEGRRSERVLAVAEPLAEAVSADIVFACPVVGEVAPSVLHGPLVGAGLQGWLRKIGPDGTVEPSIPDDFAFLAGCHVAFVSREDLAGSSIEPLRAVPILVVTDGVRGADVYSDNGSFHVPVFPTCEVDPTGAGDVFAAAFLVALARGEPLEAAARWGAASASIVVEGVGPSALCRLDEAAARYARILS